MEKEIAKKGKKQSQRGQRKKNTQRKKKKCLADFADNFGFAQSPIKMLR